MVDANVPDIALEPDKTVKKVVNNVMFVTNVVCGMCLSIVS